MKVALYWGNEYIMYIDAHSMNEFIEKVMDHVEKYWENLNSEDFSQAWRDLQSGKKATTSGRFDFYFIRELDN